MLEQPQLMGSAPGAREGSSGAGAIHALFSRRVSIENALRRAMREVKLEIDAALYSVESVPLVLALEEAHARGVRVRLVSDMSKYKQSCATRRLLRMAPFSCRLAQGRSPGTSKMHHKFLILDGAVVVTGTYNWTESSERHHLENMVWIREPRSLNSPQNSNGSGATWIRNC